MMRDSPCVDPLVCGGEKRSKQTTSAPRLTSRHEAAAPIAPPPMTATRIWLIGRDAGDRLSRHHQVADIQEQGLDSARERGGDLGVHLVRVRLHERLALVDVLAALLAPGADGDLLRT